MKEYPKAGDLVRLDQDSGGKFIGMCVSVSSNKKIWQRRAKILWLGCGRVSTILIMRLVIAHRGYKHIRT